MYTCVFCLFLAAVAADARRENASVEEIEQKVLDARIAIKSGTMSLTVKTNVDIEQPVAEKIGLDYKIYFKDQNYRVDESRRLANGQLLKNWKVFAFGRCLTSSSPDEPILFDSKGSRSYLDIGIENPVFLGIALQPTVDASGATQSDIVLPRLPKQSQNGFTRTAEREAVGGVPMWRVTYSRPGFRAVHWVAPQFGWGLVKYEEYVENRLRTKLLCELQSYSNGPVYFPREVLLRRYDEEGKVDFEIVKSVTEAQFNVDVPDSTFAIRALGIPSGREVIDDNRLRIWNGESLSRGGAGGEDAETANERRPSVSFWMVLLSVVFVILAVSMLLIHNRLKRNHV